MSNFKHQQTFYTTDSKRLERQLSELEDNVDGAMTKLKASTAPLPVDRYFTPTQASPVTPLGPDEQLAVDTVSWNGQVVLPDLDPNNFGRRFVLIKALVGPNTITVSCANPSVTCNGTTFPVLSGAAGVVVFYCNKYGYYT